MAILMKKKLLESLKKNFHEDAFIANELEQRLLGQYLSFPRKSVLNILCDCSIDMILGGKFYYQDSTFDVVIAHLVVLWQKDLKTFFAEIYRLLKKEGLLLFSSLGAERLPLPEILGDELMHCSFEQIVIERDSLILSYDNRLAIEKDLYLSGLDASCVIEHSNADELTLYVDSIFGRALKGTTKKRTSVVEVPVKKITVRNKL